MSTLVKLRFDYNNKFSPEKQRLLKEVVWEASFSPSDKEETLWQDFIMLAEDAIQFGEFHVKEIVPPRILEKLSDIRQKDTGRFNEQCHVHVGGLGVMSIDTVQVHVDLCTESLQGFLETGWRIIAVCVQPDQRRPDYIIGRTSAQ